MAYSDSSIVIHLVKHTATPNLDDVVRIVKNLDTSDFELTFKDNGDPLKQRAYGMTRDHICDYAYMLLKNLTMDEDGYEKIQLSLPAMPRVILTTSKLRDTYYRDHFLELVENSLSMLDKVEGLNIKKPLEKKMNNTTPTCSDCNCNMYSCSTPGNSNREDMPYLSESARIHRYFE